MELELEGRSVVVTGGSRGIGLAIAQAFAREGALPTIVSRSAESLQKAALDIERDCGVKPRIVAADLGQAGGLEAVVQAAGDADILVNNAGAIPGGAIADVDDARLRAAWDLKLFGYINLVRAFLPRMEQRGRGVIANVIGSAGAAPRAEFIAGSTANAALMAFTRAIGGASVHKGVRVFGVNPSGTRSDRMEGMLRARAEKQFGDAGRWQELATNLPFGRLMEPREVAELVVFCASARASYLSGTVIDLDGGQMFAAAR